jgi:hypothetical protein
MFLLSTLFRFNVCSFVSLGRRVGTDWDHVRVSRGMGCGHRVNSKLRWSIAQADPNKTDCISQSFLLLSLSRSHSPPSSTRSLLVSLSPELVRSTAYPFPMFSSLATPASGEAAYEEMSTQLAIYSQTLFEFTLRLWSESRKRAEELQRLEESAAVLNLYRPPQVRTGSVRSARKVDPNSQQ